MKKLSIKGIMLGGVDFKTSHLREQMIYLYIPSMARRKTIRVFFEVLPTQKGMKSK